jgi:hypothetical protein
MSDDQFPSFPLSGLLPMTESPVRRMSRELAAALDGEDGDDGRFRLRELLGRGASSEVYAIEDVVLRRTLALKRMKDEHVQKLGDSFLREARLLATLDHPAIPTVYDYGIDHAGRPYVLMQRFVGQHPGRVSGSAAPSEVASHCRFSSTSSRVSPARWSTPTVSATSTSTSSPATWSRAPSTSSGS